VGASKQYLTFRRAGQHCAILTTHVRGIAPVTRVTPFIQFQQRPVYVVAAGDKVNLHAKVEIVNRHLIIVERGAELAGILCERITGNLTYREHEHKNGWLYGQGRRRQIVDPDALVTAEEIGKALSEHLAKLY
jgi:chemotaxis signal transduction protein